MFIIFSIAIFILASFSLYRISKLSESTHSKLDALKIKADHANTKDELIDCWHDLCEINNKECWHKSFKPRVVEIKTILETKIQYLA